MNWRIFHKEVTESTNRDAEAGVAGDVFTADFQTGGRGRLGHRWLSAPGENLMMSAVVDVSGIAPDAAATLPLAVGLAVVRAVSGCCVGAKVELKWPNDVLVDGRKLAGILCERHGDAVIAGIGVNVRQREFPPEIADRATSLTLVAGDGAPTVAQARSAVLDALGRVYGEWKSGGFAAIYGEICSVDRLKGRRVSVLQRDGDTEPLEGVSAGIRPDGALDVAGGAVYAGEAHVMGMGKG